MIIKNDTQLVCAYLDNQLTLSEKTEFEKRLSKESHLQAKLKQFKEQDKAYRQAIVGQETSPVPESVMSLLQTEQPVKQRKFRLRKVWPVAASLAVIAVVAALTITRTIDDLEVAMFNALDNTRSATLIWLNEEQTSRMLVKLSFQHNNGQYCREYVVEQNGQANHQIACKDQQWNIKLNVPTAPLNINDGYIPAGEAQNTEIEDYLDKSMRGGGLNLSEEQVLIAQKWQHK